MGHVALARFATQPKPMKQPLPNPSQEGSKRVSALCQFPSWEGSGGGHGRTGRLRAAELASLTSTASNRERAQLVATNPGRPVSFCLCAGKISLVTHF